MTDQVISGFVRYGLTLRLADAITIRLSDMTDAELAALEARMITIPASLALEHVEEPQADGDTDAEQDTDGCADDECADASGTDT